MLKKIIMVTLLVGFSGILIWGGVNRTLAKANDKENYGAGISTSGGSNWAEEHDHEDCNENEHDATIVGNGRGNNGQGRGGGRSESLDSSEIEALYMALDDEYHALAVYQSVIETFGEVDPFMEIAPSETRHIGTLINQLNKNGLSIPENPWIGQIQPFESLYQACHAAAQAEIDNAALYAQLFSKIDDPNLTRIFTNLRNASLNNHLPEFQACQ